jgi:hypothetical protein
MKTEITNLCKACLHKYHDIKMVVFEKIKNNRCLSTCQNTQK